MKKNKKRPIYENFLDFIAPKQSDNLDDISAKLENVDNPDALLNLITKYEQLAATMENDSERRNVLAKLSAFRIKLLNLYKKKQSELLNFHWERINKENAEFVKKMVVELEDFRKHLEDGIDNILKVEEKRTK